MMLPKLHINVLALASAQAVNFLIPILILPYMTRVLGASSYGQVVFVQSIMQIFWVLIDFGYTWSATRDVSSVRHQKEKVSQIFFSVWSVQWGIFLLIVLSSLIMHLLHPNFFENWQYFYAGLGIILGQLLFPLWFYNGLEQFKVIAILQVLGKVTALPIIFLCVRDVNNIVGAILYFSIASLISGVFAIAWIVRSGMIIWCRSTKADIINSLKSASWIFASRISISSYTSAVPLVIGIVCGPTQLAYFSLADKVRAALQAMIEPVSQALLPRMSYLIFHDRSAAALLLNKAALFVSGVTLFTGLVVFTYSNSLVHLLAGDEFMDAGNVLSWLAFVPLVVVGSNLIGVQVMIPLGMNREFATIITAAALISCLGLYPLIEAWGAVGAAVLILIVESVISLSLVTYFINKKIYTL